MNAVNETIDRSESPSYYDFPNGRSKLDRKIRKVKRIWPK
jgi:hypothetical protein